jgi:hypothetical protein
MDEDEDDSLLNHVVTEEWRSLLHTTPSIGEYQGCKKSFFKKRLTIMIIQKIKRLTISRL